MHSARDVQEKNTSSRDGSEAQRMASALNVPMNGKESSA